MTSPRSLSELAARSCRPLPASSKPLTADEVASAVVILPGWAATAGAIEKTFAFADYHRTMAFVNAAAWVAHQQDHHPDLAVGYNRCTVRFSTHSIGGISENDLICAARIEQLFA